MKRNHFFISLLVVAFAIANTTDVAAQLRYGIRGEAGLNSTSIDKQNLKVENLKSFSIGPAIEFMLPLPVVNIGLDAALLYNDNRMEVNEIISGKESGGLNEKVSNRYLKLPVNAKIKYPITMLPISLYAAAGPYASYLISGDKIDFTLIEKDVKAQNFEAGANIGIGVEVLKMVQVGFNYTVKLTDNYSLSKPEWEEALNNKSGNWTVSAAVLF